MTGATPPPAYDEVVERYGLEILKSPGDLVVKDGDIALTKSRDLMLNNAEYSALFRLVQRWRFNAPTLQSLFDLVFTTKRRRKDLDASLNGAFVVRHFDRYHELNDEIGANELASVAYAGTVVLVLSGLLRSFKDDMDATRDDWEKSAPLINSCSIGSILAASANNFRHNDEWAKTRPPKQNQLASIRVLAAAFQEQIAPDGAGHRLSRDICAETLELLGGGSFDKLSANLFGFANNMVKRRQRPT
jgi:hypothetical protein